MKFIFALLLLQTAFAEDVTPPDLTLTYTCSNKAQAFDAAPLAAVFADSSNNQQVMLQGLGYKKYVPVHATKHAIIDGTIYENDEQTLTLIETNGVEEPPARTTVEYGDFTYECSALKPPTASKK